MTYATINPYTGDTVATFPDATDEEVKTALDKADAAFLSWRETSFAERGRILQNAADILRRDSDAFARLLTLEMGKLVAEAKAEVELSAKIFEYYVRHAEDLLKPEKLPVLDPAEGEAMLVHEPLGVLLAIEPWNFPYYQIARILAPQLSAGNTLILKHASNVPQSAAAFERLMNEAGLPEGAFQNLYATRDQINLIINDPRVHGVALTGSEAAGAVVGTGGLPPRPARRSRSRPWNWAAPTPLSCSPMPTWTRRSTGPSSAGTGTVARSVFRPSA